jgi:phospholipid transport system substrate-binding protein
MRRQRPALPRALRVLVAVATVVLALGTARPTAANSGPAEPVQELTTALLDTMRQADALGFSGRRERLAPVLRDVFDFGFMARLSAGRHWSSLDDAQRSRLVELFGRMSIATFAARFDGYSGQTWTVQAPRDGPRGTRLVPTRLAHPDGDTEPITVSYLMRKTDGGWRAVDVYLKGTYSEIATKRSEYSSILAREGFAALEDRIESKIAELRAGGDQAG